MRHEIEAELIESIRSGKFSEQELINLYNNAAARGSAAVMPVVKVAMRANFPRAANRMFGAKEKEANAMLEEVFRDLSAAHDLTGNRLDNGVKAGRRMVSRKKYIEVYLAYKNAAGVGAYLGLVQDSPELDVTAVVACYRTGDANPQDEQVFPLQDFAQATASYEALLSSALSG